MMTRFPRIRSFIGGVLLLLIVVVAVSSGEDPAANLNRDAQTSGTSAPSDGDLIRHGEYLVNHVAMCVQCHTPRNDDGTLNRQRLLSGAQLPVESPFEAQQWAFRAPSLRGLPGGWTREKLVEFLQTGKPPTDHEIRPPMPPFRLSKQDAQAVAAYLNSLEK